MPVASQFAFADSTRILQAGHNVQSQVKTYTSTWHFTRP
jgi:hypothetical protein